MTTLVENVAAAQRWREKCGYVGRGGVVVVLDGEVQSWVNTLRNPAHWRPGCVAVDEAGSSWTAIIGSEQDGALLWLPNEPVLN